ncbi:MAG: hypothetical protein H7Y88_04135 [Phycisphaerales bacterium]|nr:hypothetical protein [Phycisphaerales bacterium]
MVSPLVGAALGGLLAGWHPMGAIPQTASQPSTIQLGKSGQGAPIEMFRINQPGVSAEAADRLPALVVVAGVDPRHIVGIEVARRVGAVLQEKHADALKDRTVYVLPVLNPDGAAALAKAGAPWIGLTSGHDDSDRDRRLDEDGPADLDGDGAIAMMRVPNPPRGHAAWGLARTHVIDSADPRLMREPDKEKGEIATHALLIEGSDQDGDGRIAEDGPGGADLDKNFPYRWPEFTDGAGRHPLSEAESLAFVQWMLQRPNIQAVVVLGPTDNLVNLPQVGRNDAARVPLGIEEGDKASWEAVAKSYKELTRINAAPSADPAGSLRGWTYGNMGLLSFSTPVWVRPDQLKPEDKKDEGYKEGEPGIAAPASPADPDAAAQPTEAKPIEAPPANPPPPIPPSPTQAPTPATQPEPAPTVGGPGGPGGPGGRGGRGGRGGPGGFGGRGGGGEGGRGEGGGGAATTDDAAWLKYYDERVKAGDTSGFIEWKRFDHPQLGEVEIGGFRPGFKMNPPAEEVERLVGEQAAFLADVLGRFAKPELETAVFQEGPGVYRVTSRVTNKGAFPTRSEMGNRADMPAVSLLSLDGEGVTVLSGSKLFRIGRIEGGGGEYVCEWLVTGPAGGKAAVVFKQPGVIEQRAEFELSKSTGPKEQPASELTPAPTGRGRGGAR